MKNLILFVLFLAATVCVAQAPKKTNVKPDLTSLTQIDNISLDLKGLSVEDKIDQEQLIKLKQLDLKGDDAAKYKITYYHFKTNYQHTISQDEFFDNAITEGMTRFFTDLEKNCKLIYEDIVVQNTESGKSFKLAPLAVIVKVELKK